VAALDIPEEEGEGYFASVSDLMVGILFVFLLMLTVFALNFREAEDDQRVARNKYEQLQRELQVKEEEAALNLAEARAQRQEADRQRHEADVQRRNADKQRREAEAQRRAAEEQQRQADAQREKNKRLQDLLKEAAERLRQEVEGRQFARQRLLLTLRERLSKAGIAVEVDPETGVLHLPEQLLFEKGQSALGVLVGSARPDPVRLADAEDKLGKLANALAEILPCFAATGGNACPQQDRSTLEGVLIEGHSDKQGYRGLTQEESIDRNDRLSVERALTVFKEVRTRDGLGDLLNSQGVPMLGLSAYGDRRPLVAGMTDEELRPNRRIDLRFLLSTRTSEDLQKLLDRIRPALEEANP
jgi:flagellar motor protein MotB